MASNDNVSMALFCDFENVALGVRDANYEKFDIKPVLERLLLKGSIVVKKAYCDWDRYKAFKSPMHEANFELIEIPHVRISGKNSADIRMVVDALDLCYTKAHVNTFVIISGDSDFSPLVSKLRENNKKVIGVGVKDSTSDLLVANCDEFIFYDDLVRESRRHAKRDPREQPPKRSPEEEKRKRDEMDKRRTQAVDIAYETFDALIAERGDSGKIWASVLKEAIKRRKPDFSESYYGFRTFGNLLEEMKARGLLEFGRDEKSGAYVYRSAAAAAAAAEAAEAEGDNQANGEQQAPAAAAVQASAPAEAQEPREGRRNRGNRGGRNRRPGAGEAVEQAVEHAVEHAVENQSAEQEEPAEPAEPAAQPWGNVAAFEADETDEVAEAVEVAPDQAANDRMAELQSAERALEEMAQEVREARRAKQARHVAEAAAALAEAEPQVEAEPEIEAEAEPANVEEAPAEAAPAKRTRAATARKPAAKKPARTSKVAKAAADAAEAVEAVLAQAPAAVHEPESEPVAAAEPAAAPEDEPAAAAKPARKPGTQKTPSRSRLPRKPKASSAD